MMRRIAVVATLLISSAGVVALSVALLLPRWLEQRAVRTLIQSLAIDDQDSLDAAIKAVQKFDHGRAAVEPLIQSFRVHEPNVDWPTRYALIELRSVSAKPLIGTLANTAKPIDDRVAPRGRWAGFVTTMRSRCSSTHYMTMNHA